MIFRTLINALKPFQLLSLVMTYLLGAGLVQYVREIRSWAVFVQGGIFLLLVYLSVEYLRLLHQLTDPQKWPDGMAAKDARQIRWFIAMIAATLLTVATPILISWMQAGILWQGMVSLLAALLAVGGFYYFTYSITVLRPFEILIEVLLFIVIPPAFAFFLQSNDLHRLLFMVVIPLVPGYLAYRLLILLRRFGSDHKHGIETLVIHIGWENAMLFHNALILLSYLLFAFVALIGFPWFLIWPVFLTLPIGLLEIWLMERVRRGMKPLWGIMQVASACVFFIPLYLFGFAFWIR